MKFNEFLTENPMIFDMERDELDDLYTKRRDVEKFNGKKIGTVDGYDMYQYTKGVTEHFALFDNDDDTESVVSSRCTSITRNGNYQQGLILKKSEIKTDTLMKFFYTIVGILKFVISDDLQSTGGKKFWQRVIGDNVGGDKYEVGTLIHGRDPIKYNAEKWRSTFNSTYTGDNPGHVTHYIKVK